jgi:hypothetical protein
MIKNVTMMAAFALTIGDLQADPQPSPSLEQRVKDLETKLQTLERIPIIAVALNVANANATPAPTPQINAPLELVRWWYQLDRGQYEFQTKHEFTYVLKNRTAKAIKMVQGYITFSDPLGQKLMSIRLEEDKLYPSGDEASVTGNWDFNQFQSGEMRMSTVKHDDVKATLVIEKLLFTDGTTWSANQ